jgi:hypothetical protein
MLDRNWNNAETKLVFNPGPGQAYSYDLWTPELTQYQRPVVHHIYSGCRTPTLRLQK